MKHTTPPDKWRSATALNLLFTGGYIASVFYNLEHLTTAYLVLFWIFIPFAVLMYASVLWMTHDDEWPRHQKFMDDVWTERVTNLLAYSTPFLWYRNIVDVIFILALILSGHPYLGVVTVIATILGRSLVTTARDIKESRAQQEATS